MITQALQAAGSGDIGGAAGLIEEAAQVRLGESGAVVEARAELARRAAGRSPGSGSGRFPHRSMRKNVRTSSTNSAGCSKAAK